MKQKKKARRKIPVKVTPEEPITFVAGGELHLRGNIYVPIKIALPRGDFCMGVFRVSELYRPKKDVFRGTIFFGQTVGLHVAGCNFTARVAATADDSGAFLVYAADVLHGMARSCSMVTHPIFKRLEAKAQRHG